MQTPQVKHPVEYHLEVIKMGSLNSVQSPSFYSNKHFINGEYVNSVSKETYTVWNPKDGSILSDQMAAAGSDDVEAAVNAAEAAFHGPWSQFNAQQRAGCLTKLAAIMEERLTEILTLDSLASGNPVSLIPTREKTYIITALRYYAGWTDKQKGDYFPADDGFVKLVRHEPLGVCAGINPFNAPIATFIFKLAPALATGNVIILKPSEKTPFGSLALGPLFEERESRRVLSKYCLVLVRPALCCQAICASARSALREVLQPAKRSKWQRPKAT